MQAKIHSQLNSSCHVKTVICPRNVSLIHGNRGPTETNGQNPGKGNNYISFVF